MILQKIIRDIQQRLRALETREYSPTEGDPDAIHDNVAGEIILIAEKVAPANADVLVIEDSAAANIKKRVQIVNLPGGADPNAIHVNVAGEIAGIAPKAVPIAADLIVIEDSAAANAKKSVQVGNLPGNVTNWMWHTFIFTMEGILTIGASPLRIYVPGDFTIDRVYISVDTAPTGQAIIVDVNKNGVTIFTVQANRPQIAAAANTGNSGVPDITALALNDYLTFDRDQVGNPVAGSDLTVHVRCQQFLQI